LREVGLLSLIVIKGWQSTVTLLRILMTSFWTIKIKPTYFPKAILVMEKYRYRQG
ncbi:MAG: hypothetical protein ACJAUL_003040, partial [Paraglaciecola sp.]